MRGSPSREDQPAASQASGREVAFLDKAKGAISAFNGEAGSAISASIISASGRRIEVELAPRGADGSCCLDDYFDDLSLKLEREIGFPIAAFDSRPAPKRQDTFLVKYAILDFLDELQKPIAEAQDMVAERMEEFAAARRDEGKLFSELCFCILTANFTAEGGIRIQDAIGDSFSRMDCATLSKILRQMHHRFPNKRAEYIVEAQALCGALSSELSRFTTGKGARRFLAESVMGLGYKESSHFLRNIGYTDVAIIDRHILRYLERKGLIEPGKALTRRRYLAYERILEAIADRLGVTLAELDLYIWYMETGKVLK